MNINRQLRFAAAFSVMLCIAGFVLRQVAHANEIHERRARNLASTKLESGLKPAVTVDPVNGGGGPFTNSPDLRVRGQMDSSGRFQLLGTNANWESSYFDIEASSNLVNWTRISTIYDFGPARIGTGFVFTDAASTGSTRRYYRVIDKYLFGPTPP